MENYRTTSDHRRGHRRLENLVELLHKLATGGLLWQDNLLLTLLTIKQERPFNRYV